MTRNTLTLLLLLATLCAWAQGTYNVRDYGATGDGRTLDDVKNYQNHP